LCHKEFIISKKQHLTELGRGNYLRLIRDGRWEYADRVNARGAVAIIAATSEQQFVLTEQFRHAVKRSVIDLPAGLIGDVVGEEDERSEVSALRELVEETGFHASKLTHLADCPSSPGLTSEIVSYFLARKVTRVSQGGGVEHENILVHTPKIRSIKSWIRKQVSAGKLIDPKVYAGLYFLSTQ